MLGSNVSRAQDVLLTRFDAAALVPVLAGRQLLLVHVERASDILQVLGLKREFPNLRLVLVGATEGWTVAEQIRASGVPVIANALVDLPASFEQLAATQSNFGRMRAAGINVAMGTINEDETRMVQVSRQNAGNLVALTRVPGRDRPELGRSARRHHFAAGEVMGLGGEIGSLKAGRRADVVIWTGDPLDTTSTAQMVMIDGVQQPLETRQTKLRDRYLRAGEQGMPKAYER
jgi:imidazolonepropionase-like amidohydrolase